MTDPLLKQKTASIITTVLNACIALFAFYSLLVMILGGIGLFGNVSFNNLFVGALVVVTVIRNAFLLLVSVGLFINGLVTIINANKQGADKDALIRRYKINSILHIAIYGLVSIFVTRGSNKLIFIGDFKRTLETIGLALVIGVSFWQLIEVINLEKEAKSKNEEN